MQMDLCMSYRENILFLLYAAGWVIFEYIYSDFDTMEESPLEFMAVRFIQNIFVF